MNPFELPGPQFLAFYAVLGILVVWSLRVAKQRAEAVRRFACRRWIHI